MDSLFLELTLVLVLAGGIALLVSFFKQPNIIAYILTGLILGPFGYYKLHQGETLESLAQVGTTLLLFMVGLELDITQLRRIGRTAIIAGISQVAITSSLGYLILKALGFEGLSAAYMAIALTFSSTIIVVKLLSEKRDLQSLYGRIVVGIFLVQDFIALILLMVLTNAGGGAPGILGDVPFWQQIIFTLTKGLLLGLFVAWQSVYVFPRVLKFIGTSDELLMVFSLAWGLGLAALVSLPFIGFSLEIGGFIAGLALSRSAVHYEISARIRSLRDFFIIIFFIVLGSHLVFSDIGQLTMPTIILSAFVLIGNPLIVLIILGALGYKPRTSFLSAVTLGQISEFSLILVALGLKLGHLSQNAVGLVTMVGITTIALSSYSILYAERIFAVLEGILRLFDFRKGSAEKQFSHTEWNRHIIVAGAHRLGDSIVNSLAKKEKHFLIVDFNPEVVERYTEHGISALCGDITDPYIQELARVDKAHLIISTLPHLHDNLALIESIRKSGSKAKFIVTAQNETDALHLYEKHVDYVLLPHYIGGQHLAKIMEHEHPLAHLTALKRQHLKVMRKRT